MKNPDITDKIIEEESKQITADILKSLRREKDPMAFMIEKYLEVKIKSVIHKICS